MSKIDQFQKMVSLRNQLFQAVMNDQLHVVADVDYDSNHHECNHFIAVYLEVINDDGIWEIPNQDILSLFSLAVNHFKERLVTGAIHEADLLVDQYAREVKYEVEHVLSVLCAHEKTGSAVTDPTNNI